MTLHGDEGRRQAYLAALGIPVWSARHTLAQAAASDGLDFVPFLSDVEEPAALSEDEAAAGFAPMEPVDAPPPVPTRPVAQATTPVAAVKPAAVPAAPASAEAPVRTRAGVDFPRFMFWHKSLPQGWQLLVALGDVPDLSAQEHMLLAQIESVLGGSGQQGPVTFRWPLNNNPAIPRDAKAAAESVGAFLKRGHQAGTRYLVLGLELVPFVQAALAGEKLAAGASLSQLLAEPVRKRELWQSLMVHL